MDGAGQDSGAPSPGHTGLGTRGQVALLLVAGALVALALVLDPGPSLPAPQVGPVDLVVAPSVR
jgi:hypothetical protein